MLLLHHHPLGDVLSVWASMAHHVSVFQPVGREIKEKGEFAKEGCSLEVVQVTSAHVIRT